MATIGARMVGCGLACGLASLAVWSLAADSTPAARSAGIKLYAQGDYGGALAMFQKGVLEEGEGAVSQAAVCLTQLHLGRYGDAIATFKRFLPTFGRRNPGGPAAKRFFGTAALVRLFAEEPGHAALIKEFAERFIAAEPDSPAPYEVLGVYSIDARDGEALDTAIRHLRRVEPGAAELHVFQGLRAVVLKDRKRAAAEFKRAASIEPRFEQFARGQGRDQAQEALEPAGVVGRPGIR